METIRYIPTTEGDMKTDLFKVVVESDKDRWSAYCRALLKQGAATWGTAREEAVRHINEVVHMIVAALIEDGEPIPEDVSVSRDPLVSVTV